MEFEANSTDNTDHIEQSMKYKFVDDLSLLEMLNLLVVGLTDYNFEAHVASDIGVEQKYLEADKFAGQSSLNAVEKWTKENKMKLNVEKTNIMVFNFTKDHQFATRLSGPSLPCWRP